MNDVKKRCASLPEWGLLLLGAVLFLFSNGRWAVAPIAWFAPVPFLVMLRGRKSAWGAVALLPFFILASWIMLRGIIPPWLGLLALGLSACFGLMWWFPFCVDALMCRRIPEPFRFFIFPAALTAGEFLCTLVFGDWGSQAFSQAENLHLLQVVSLTGIWGITFLMGCFASLATFVLREGWTKRSIRRAGAGFIVAWMAVMIYGGCRLSFGGGGPTVRIGSFAAHEGEKGIAGLPELIAGSRQLAAFGARVVFWPEGLLNVSSRESAVIEREAGRLSRELGIYFMPSFHREPGTGSVGSQRTVLFGPDGRRLWDYVKSHPVPGSPDMKGPGQVPLVQTPFARLGAAICYDFDFPHFIRQAGKGRVDLMLDPSWDWREIDPLHTRMAVVRAVENGFSLVRHTMAGLSIAVDPLGRTRASLDHYETAERRFIADVPVQRTPTFYSWAGDWLPWVCMIYLLCGFFFLAKRGFSDLPNQ
ncbi:MAG: hypothetical protein PHX05_04060 [Acidobacteriota bacterium]|nr:hypothetical protein [Acidobacteriota bacterium]